MSNTPTGSYVALIRSYFRSYFDWHSDKQEPTGSGTYRYSNSKGSTNMSGGQWDYIQNDMVHIAGDLELECGRKQWNPATQAQIVDAIVAIRLAAIYVERIDWLLSGDDDEGSFHARLMEQLAERKEIRKEVIKQVQRSARKWRKEQ